MKEIRIYHSLWRMLLMMAGCVTFVNVAILMCGDDRIPRMICGVLAVLFFSFGFFAFSYMLIMERLMGSPYISVSDQQVIVRGVRPFVVHFCDVEAFQLIKMNSQTFISIHFKPNVELAIIEEGNFFLRMLRRFNNKLTGAQEHISTTGLGMKPQELLNILNERLRNSAR